MVSVSRHPFGYWQNFRHNLACARCACEALVQRPHNQYLAPRQNRQHCHGNRIPSGPWTGGQMNSSTPSAGQVPGVRISRTPVPTSLIGQFLIASPFWQADRFAHALQPPSVSCLRELIMATRSLAIDRFLSQCRCSVRSIMEIGFRQMKDSLQAPQDRSCTTEIGAMDV